MTDNLYIPLKNRSAFSVSGNDASGFLQGLITNDITKTSDGQAIYALMLTPQGKFLYDFFIVKKDESYFIDCETDKLLEIIKKLSMYKLRSDVQIKEESEYEIVAVIGEKTLEIVENEGAGDVRIFCKGIAYIDPRSRKIFGRSFIEKSNSYQSFIAYNFKKGKLDDYEFLRIKQGIPAGHIDLTCEKSFPLDFNMNNLNAIDYKKGCYVGQEVTARVNHRGKIRKNIFTIQAKNGNLPESGSKITANEISIGYLCSSIGSLGLALLKIDEADKELDEVIIIPSHS